MRSTLIGVLVGTAGLLLAGCESRPVFGGYTSMAIENPQVGAMAAVAVEAQEKIMRDRGEASRLTLLRIITAGQQVVAGTNYRLRLGVRVEGAVSADQDRESREVREAEATVWQKLSGEPVLTSWKWIVVKPQPTFPSLW